MVAFESGIVDVILALAFFVAGGYAMGRIHQAKRYESERDDAFRQGYNQAACALFEVARRAGRRISATAGASRIEDPARRADPAPVIRRIRTSDLVSRTASAAGGARRRIIPGQGRPSRPGHRR